MESRPDLSSQAQPNFYVGYRLTIGYRLRDLLRMFNSPARLSAALLIVLDHLRHRFARFKLCAHLLDLRGLFFELRREDRHSLL